MEGIYDTIGYIVVHGIVDFVLPNNQSIINFIGAIAIGIFFFFAIGFQSNLSNKHKQHLFDHHKDDVKKAYDEINKSKKYRNYSIVSCISIFLILHIISAF